MVVVILCYLANTTSNIIGFAILCVACEEYLYTAWPNPAADAEKKKHQTEAEQNAVVLSENISQSIFLSVLSGIVKGKLMTAVAHESMFVASGNSGFINVLYIFRKWEVMVIYWVRQSKPNR